MSLVRNPNTLTQMRDVLQQQSGHDTINDQVVLVAETNPKLLKEVNINASAAQSTTGSITIYTVPSGADYYLWGFQYSMIKDATCDQAGPSIQISCTSNGQAFVFARFAIITTTAQVIEESREFSRPIKLDAGSTISMTGTFTAGAMARACSVQIVRLESQ